MKRMSVRIQWRYAVAAVTLGFVLILTQTGQGHLGPEEPLNFFKNYFVTGDYVVGGVDLEPVSGKQGFLRGTIPMSGVPDDAEILAAFLYWKMIVTGFDPVEDILVGSKFRDVDISTFAKLIGEEVLSPATAPCWSSEWRIECNVHTQDVPRRRPSALADRRRSGCSEARKTPG